MNASLILFILGGVLLCSVLGSEDSSEEDALGADGELFLKFVMHLGWAYKKTNVLAAVVKYLTGKVGTDVHLIATQDIVDEKTGEIAEVKALELRFPKLENVSFAGKDEKFEVDEIITFAEETREVLEQMSSFMYKPHSTFEKKLPHSGNITEFFYVDLDTIFYRDEVEAFINQTYTVSPDELKTELDKIKTELKDNLVPPSILKFDVDNNFVQGESQISPLNLATVEYKNEATLKHIEKVAEEYVSTLLNEPEEAVPEKLSKRLKKAYPEFSWYVVQEVVDYYSDLSSDVQIDLSLDSLWKDKVEFKIYGYKK